MMLRLHLSIDVIFDCNTYLRSVVAPNGLAAACLALMGTEAITVFVSRDILTEVRETLSRPALRQKFEHLTEESMIALLQRLQTDAILLHNVPETFRYSRDPDDEIYINLALVTNAQYLVTYDKDLLDLMGDNEAGRDFRHRFPHLKIVDPLLFLEAMRAEKQT